MIIGYETTLAIATISVLLLISVYRGRKEIAEALRKGISRLSIASFLAILVFFLLFELLKVYPVEQLYFDENIYLSIALNILHSGNALWCQFGTAYVRQCYVNAVYHDPVGWTVFIALAFALFGVSNAVAFNLELLVGALSVLGVFLLSSVVFEKPEISVLSTLAFALSPELLIWSRSLADIDLPFMMLTVFAFFFFVIFAKKRNRTTLAMFLFSMLLAAYMRIEGILLIPLFLVLLFLYSDQGVRETARKTWRQIIEIINGDTKTILLAFLALSLIHI